MTVWYNEDIAQFKQGIVVRINKGLYKEMIGHVQGFGLNSTMEVIVNVSLCNGSVEAFHPSCIDVL